MIGFTDLSARRVQWSMAGTTIRMGIHNTTRTIEPFAEQR